MWIAREGDDIVGISVLAYPPMRGNVWPDWTGTARKVRGRGVARALKLETVMQAIALGVKSVRTENDGENAPILHLNEQMGYRASPAGFSLEEAAPAARAATGLIRAVVRDRSSPRLARRSHRRGITR